jgi:hypothetical protein
MARDRFIMFEAGKRPTIEEVKREIEGYGLQTKEWEEGGNRFFIVLPGTFVKYGEVRERWIEVVFNTTEDDTHVPGYVDVLTRAMDAITNDIADGLARFLARQCVGKLDPADFNKTDVEQVAAWVANHEDLLENTIQVSGDPEEVAIMKHRRGIYANLADDIRSEKWRYAQESDDIERVLEDTVHT